jgi:hypothetical protein
MRRNATQFSGFQQLVSPDLPHYLQVNVEESPYMRHNTSRITFFMPWFLNSIPSHDTYRVGPHSELLSTPASYMGDPDIQFALSGFHTYSRRMLLESLNPLEPSG